MAVCFEVTVNDQAPVVAGHHDIGVLTAILSYVSGREEMEVQVGGLVSSSARGKEHVSWVHRELRPGDEVRIRVIDSNEPADPIERRREDPDAAAQHEREYYERLRRKYADDRS